MKIKIVKLTDGKSTWNSILIDSLGVAQICVRDLIGGALCEYQFGDHSIYNDNTDEQIINSSTVKSTFKNIYRAVMKKDYPIMNNRGGYIRKSLIDWKILEEIEVEHDYEDNLKTIPQITKFTLNS